MKYKSKLFESTQYLLCLISCFNFVCSPPYSRFRQPPATIAHNESKANIVSVSDVTRCMKNDKPLVVYTFITTLRT